MMDVTVSLLFCLLVTFLETILPFHKAHLPIIGVGVLTFLDLFGRRITFLTKK